MIGKFDILKSVCTYKNSAELIIFFIPEVPIESTFLRVDSQSRLFPWIQCGIHEKGMGFSKRVDSYGNSYFKNSRVDPALLHNSYRLE